MTFNSESEFEEAVVSELLKKGWGNKGSNKENSPRVLKYATKDQLLKNWADILLQNNPQIDRLNNIPLTKTEMQQIIEKINELRTTLKLNSLVNGKTISIKRDNPNDIAHLGKEISLKIYDRNEIAGGKSVYQIVEQPIFNTNDRMLNDRRGDLMLLINGMPLIHIELKKSNVPVSEATNQIEKYSHEGVFDDFYSLIQIFVAMTPEETVYFANPGRDGRFNPDYYFHWEDANNEPVNKWNEVVEQLLNIPMAHQLIGFYTVADDTDGVLKVMRSYQYFAASRISDKVAMMDWNEPNIRGGYIWHTTGSGKTMTSFKSAQLIASSNNADKVIFLIDRIELGIQSLRDYQGFADADESVQATENTDVLISKLKSNNPQETLIVTSIQKMSRIDGEKKSRENDIKLINKKRIVIIVDECHRGQFGEMHQKIRDTFPKAVFFGFTGTPIFEENQKNKSMTADIFGDELHRYSIADGIRDKNVLGFDIYKVQTFKNQDLRRAVALEKAKAKTEEDAIKNSEKSKIYYEYMNKPMATYTNEDGETINGIEDYIPMTQYRTREHREMVIENILENYNHQSHERMFHSIFATSSIQEAIEYYRMFKEKNTELRITMMVDPSIDNNEGAILKEDALKEVLIDYKNMFGLAFSLQSMDVFKKDISLRLAHKKVYSHLNSNETIDILIVVDQMLTGYDSKWINTLYLDKVLKEENIIQAFSRTNRLFDPELKPHGTIKYYRKPYTMEKNIELAIKHYSGDRPYGIFVPKLEENVNEMKRIYKDIKEVFNSSGIEDFSHLPEDKESKKKFVSLYNDFSKYLAAARIQGFEFSKDEEKFSGEGELNISTLKIEEKKEEYDVSEKIKKEDYEALKQRYIELGKQSECSVEETYYDIKGYLAEADKIQINNDYMNSKFQKYLRALKQENISEHELVERLNELHKSFAMLDQNTQKYANVFLHDIQNGSIQIDESKSFMDYITEYQKKAENDVIKNIVNCLGVDENKLRGLTKTYIDGANINEYGRFDDLKNTVNMEKATKYFNEKEKREVSPFEVNIKVDELLRKFIITGIIE